MILVSGTKRSGTSMWMKVLGEAGLPILGEAWPRDWESGPLQDANPGGFYESTLREGINFTTNPDPRTGAYLHPARTRQHAVKVFLPGMTRTDLVFMDRVLFTVREWKAYAWSVAELAELERQAQGHPPQAVVAGWPHVLEWWLENFMGLRDLLLRRYACHVLTYESVLAHPRGTVTEALRWLEVPNANVEAAVAVVQGDIPAEAPMPEGVPDDVVPTLDALYNRIHQGIPFDPAFIEEINALHDRLTPLLYEHYRQSFLHRKHRAEVDRSA